MAIDFTWDQYVADVLDGTIPACRWVKLACERHERDLRLGHERGLWFDENAAKVSIAFAGVCRHWKGEWGGKPVRLVAAQQFWFASMFGWKRDDGTRRFRTAYLEVARKNAKTTTAAIGGILLAFVEGEPGAEVYSAATKRDQAKIVFNDAKQMVKASPQLKQIITPFTNNLHAIESGSKFEPLSSDHNSLDGLNIHAAIADELHAWPDPALWGVLKTGTGSRRQPIMLAITTAGVNQEGICYSQREYLTRILKGIVEDDGFWGMIYTIDTKRDWPDLEIDDDWQDENNWLKANPLLGVSKKWSTMRQDALEAAAKPLELNQFLRWHLNVWTQAVTRWINPARWAACGAGAIDEDDLVGMRCYGGLDLSSVNDLSAFVLVFPPDEDDFYRVVCRFWLPAENMLERVRRDQVPYDVWARLGFIKLTPGNVIDYDFIEAEIKALAERFEIVEIGFDRWGSTQIMQHLQAIGGDEWVVPIGQGYASMSPPMKELERLYLDGKLAHGNNPVLNWMADNLVAIADPAGNIKPDKAKSRERIDGMVALIMAADRAVRQVDYSKYEDEGLFVL